MALGLLKEGKEQRGEQASSLTASGLKELRERLIRVKQFMRQVEYLLIEEAQRTDQIERGFESSLESLEAHLEAKEAVIKQKDLALTKLQENLRELEELRAKINGSETLTSTEAEQLREIMGSWQKATAAFVGQLRRTEMELNQKSRALKEMEESLRVLKKT